MRSRRRMAGVLLLVSVAGTCGAATPAVVDPTAALVGQRLVTLAYKISRATALTPALAAQEAEIFLESARREDPGNVHTLKLLVEAAAATNNSDVQRSALRELIRQDPGDLVAQVRYIDLLAAGAETIDGRAKVFQGALDAATLDPQIRSEMAERLATIAQERGDLAGARALVQKSLQLNDVNVGALWGAVRLAEKPAERVAALVAVLHANPLQPDAWVELSRIMAEAGMYDRAADYLTSALEQYQLAGQPPAAELYLELGEDLVTAGRRVEAYPILSALEKLPDAPMSVLVAAQLLANEYTPKPLAGATTATSAPASQPGDELADRIQKKLMEQVKASPKSPSVLADAVWVELSVMPEPATVTEKWMTALRGVVDSDDPVLARLEGWRLLRAGKLEEARAILEKAAPADPLAQLGYVRVLIAQNKKAEAGRQLQDLWWTHPTGILAEQVAQTARSAGDVKLADAISGRELLAALRALPTTAAGAHREPRDLQLVTASFPERNFDLEQPVMLRLRINNTTDHAIAVGPDGLAKTTVALSGRALGVDAQNFGVYVIEELQRVYRLEARQAVEASVRVDEGALAEYLSANPRETCTVVMGVMTAPRGTIDNATPGLGGQNVSAGDFQRRGVAMGSGGDITQLTKEMLSTTGREQALKAGLLSLAVQFLSDEQVRRTARIDEAPEVTTARTELRATVTKALVPVLQSKSAATRAWVLLNLPMEGLNELQAMVMGMSDDQDPVVRILWGQKMGQTAKDGGPLAGAALDALKRQSENEPDPLARRALQAMVQDVQQAADAAKQDSSKQDSAK